MTKVRASKAGTAFVFTHKPLAKLAFWRELGDSVGRKAECAKKPEAYPLRYVEDFFAHFNAADDRRS